MKAVRHSLSTIKRLIFYFDRFTCTIPLGDDLEFVVYERPGSWCSEAELSTLVNDLRTVARMCQGEKDIPTYGPLSGRREDLAFRIISVAYDRKAQRPVGFSAQAYLPLTEGHFRTEVVHLGLIYVEPSLQGKSVSYLLSLLPNVLILLKSGFRNLWVSSVSQVPAVVGLVASNYSNVYPSYRASDRQTFWHRKLATLIMERHRSVFGVGSEAEFDLDSQIIRNSYTGGSDQMKKSYQDSTPHRNTEVNEMCRLQLNYERGDDFLQLGRLGNDVILGLFKNKIKNLSRFHILGNLFLILIVSALVPALRWIIPPVRGQAVRV
jgi:hypothetical protein